MVKKIFYINSEMEPFASVSNLANLSVDIPLGLQDQGNDVRCLMPKYGFISERKYILREVIRLREIPFSFCGEEEIASAKSAFIPKTRVQVYFLESDEWFQPLNNLLYKSKNGRVLMDNPMRYAYYSKAVLSTLPHLFWVPDILVCNGWQSALIPNYYKNEYEGISDFYKKIKSVLVIHDLDDYSKVDRSDLVKMGVKIDPKIRGNNLNIYDVASYSADAILIMDRPGEKISSKLLKKAAFKDNQKKVIVFEQEDLEEIDFYAMTESLNQIVSDITSK